MEELFRLCRLLEVGPGQEMIRAEWERRLGACVEQLLPYLHSTGALASNFRCPNGAGDGCPRQVHSRGDGTFEAVCGNVPPDCERVLLRKSDLALLRLDSAAALAPLVEEVRAREYLAPASVELFEGFLPIGRLERHAGTALVVLTIPARAEMRTAALELKRRADADKVVVLVGGRRQDQSSLDDIVELEIGPDEDPGLWRASKMLWPESWKRRGTDPEGIFEDVTLEIGTSEERHVVKLNGVHVHAFDQSDIKLARLIALAAQRVREADIKDGGWLNKDSWLWLDKKEEDLAVLRAAFFNDLPKDFAKLTTVERKALIKASTKRTGFIRLALHPRRIRFDASLREFRHRDLQQADQQNERSRPVKKKPVRRPTAGSKALKEAQEKVRQKVEWILDYARGLGAPVPTTAELRRS